MKFLIAVILLLSAIALHAQQTTYAVGDVLKFDAGSNPIGAVVQVGIVDRGVVKKTIAATVYKGDKNTPEFEITLPELPLKTYVVQWDSGNGVYVNWMIEMVAPNNRKGAMFVKKRK